MRKSDKKIENQIREVLTEVCEDTLKGYDGFLWVTHTVKYSSFPQSLKIVCVFDTIQDRANFLMGEGQLHVSTAIQKTFNKVGVQLKNVDKLISYDIQKKRESGYQKK
ncbi:Fis family transcriptional regulator [Vibrio penaeicida]|uniref:Fis family transcriptional regulator n=1 Tax=Vibrio penaeicida TaxID=104609 RepID=A0AAV5NVF5_9VIBR|nr:Fis family transcriptional regulator [Vibrio penaeicida]RTZ23691.1 Fis family transcriptional regulator [Vibrio penaeicida]GLQ74433.1 hypothetical protein GCM10007932_37940 [Vibrio penaeicida]